MDEIVGSGVGGVWFIVDKGISLQVNCPNLENNCAK